MFAPLMLSLCCLGEAPSTTEHFVMEERGVPVATVTMRRVPLDGGYLLEQETFFRTGGVHVIADEYHSMRGPSPRYIWRELRSVPGTGSTWLAEWEPEGFVRTMKHGTQSQVHGQLEGPRPTFPLELIEELRAGQAKNQVTSLDPLTSSRVDLDITEKITAKATQPRRTYDVRFTGGELQARYEFEGTSLMGFQWQTGSRIARPADAEELRKLHVAWRSPDAGIDPAGRPRVRAR